MLCLLHATSLPPPNAQASPWYVISGVGEKYGNLIGGNAYKVAEQIAEEANA